MLVNKHMCTTHMLVNKHMCTHAHGGEQTHLHTRIHTALFTCPYTSLSCHRSGPSGIICLNAARCRDSLPREGTAAEADSRLPPPPAPSLHPPLRQPLESCLKGAVGQVMTPQTADAVLRVYRWPKTAARRRVQYGAAAAMVTPAYSVMSMSFTCADVGLPNIQLPHV